MNVSVKRVDSDLPLPEYQTAGAAAMDLSAREGRVVSPKSVEVFALNIALQLPKGHFGLMAARSSLWKRGLMLANNVAIFDEDFGGDGDEYQAALYNFTDQPVEVKRGDRVTQLIILPYDKIAWNEVDVLGSPNRGAYGTTGV